MSQDAALQVHAKIPFDPGGNVVADAVVILGLCEKAWTGGGHGRAPWASR
jgi:hypothetical protein